MGVNEVGILLFVAALVSMVCRRFKVPYTVGLTITGFVLGFLPRVPDFPITKELIFSALLPPLVFEAAFQIPWTELKKNLAVIGVLATLGVLLSVAIVSAGLYSILGWSINTALILAVLISATDPVSVIATFKSTNVPDRLKLLVEAESLLNDGTAAVLFAIVLATVNGNAVTPIAVARDFIVTVAGGIAIGGAIGTAAVFLSGRARDHLAEITFSSLAAYASFLVAERFHMSGVLATMTAGLILGNVTSFVSSEDRGREAVDSFWEYVAFVANSLVFLLIGLRVADRPLLSILGPACVLIVLTLLGRSFSVYFTCALFNWSKQRIPFKSQHILVWGGLRGALALALALGLPLGMPLRQEILDLTFGVVAFSVIVQGLTLSPLLKKLGLVGPQLNAAEAKS